MAATSQKNAGKFSIQVKLRGHLFHKQFWSLVRKVFTTIIIKSVARFRQTALINLGKRRF